MPVSLLADANTLEQAYSVCRRRRSRNGCLGAVPETENSAALRDAVFVKIHEELTEILIAEGAKPRKAAEPKLNV